MRIQILALILMAIGCKAPNRQNQNTPKLNDGMRVSEFLGETLVRDGQVGSIIIHGTCNAHGFILENLHANTIDKSSDVESTLKTVVAANDQLKYSRDQDGIWRILDRNASTDLLQEKLPSLAIKSFSSNHAVAQLLNSPEVDSYVKEHAIIMAPSFGGLGPVNPSALPFDLLNIHESTLAGELDQIAQHYQGVWVYRECLRDDGRGAIDVHIFEK